MEQPAWLAHAWREFGVREVAGAASNDRILQFFRDIGHNEINSDEIAWCAAFVGACLERSGYTSTRSLLARSYLDWGTELQAAKLGAIAVCSRGNDPGKGHVGFVVGADATRVFLLGGNQQNSVSVQPYERARLLGLRWPGEKTIGAQTKNEVFERALTHVLEMEGGWSNDPYDPGGPTNRGITLAVYAAYRGVELTDFNKGTLLRELKKLTVADVRPIYYKRYWVPSRAADLPPPLALMHFDAAVNHGVGNAARMLQRSLGVTVDGIIGPQTLAAANSQRVEDVINKYADIRRARYRSLGHFWRFGRGWLRRVDRTLAASRRLINRPHSSSSQPHLGEQKMAQEVSTTGSSKLRAHSMTIWGALITAAATVLPAIGPLIGIEITPDLVREFGEQVAQLTQAVIGLIGIIMTIYGHVRATSSLERHRTTSQL